MATHSSILAWRIPWTQDLGGLQFVGLQPVGRDGVLARVCVHAHTQPPLILTSAFLGPPSRKPCGVGKQAAGQKPRAVSGLGECGSGTN